MTSQTETRVRDILSTDANLQVPAHQLKLDDDLSLFGLNSIDFVKVIVSIEGSFDIEFEDEELILSRFLTLQDFITQINAKLAASGVSQ